MYRTISSNLFKPLVFLGILILCIGSCTIIELAMQGESTESEEIDTTEASEVVTGTPSEVYSDFSAMERRVQRMRRSSISNMSDDELRSVGAPLLSAALNTVQFSEETLRAVREPLNAISRSPRTLSSNEHRRLSQNIVRAVSPQRGSSLPARTLETENLRQIFLNINGGNTSETCNNLFNVDDGRVLLAPGDHFNIANSVCPEGTVFVILSGTHTRQAVQSSKNGNVWLGLEGAILDGDNEIARAFSGGLAGNTIRNIDIRNYTDHGIHSSGVSDVHILNNRFQNIAPEKHGQGHGGIMFLSSNNLDVSGNHFEEVASSIRFVDSNGPLRVTENTALNSGRNFFQCDKCNGGGIRINRNSMEQTQQFGIVALEDWINIYQSNGLEDDPIQVNRNRARGYGDSDSGSFILLADGFGSFQEAVGNIGVSPGQVGIGVASGTHITIASNKMYSEEWEHSNVAYYSANLYSSDCGPHTYAPGTNKANWRSSNGRPNRSWTDGRCGLTIANIRNFIEDDPEMGPGIWNEW